MRFIKLALLVMLSMGAINTTMAQQADTFKAIVPAQPTENKDKVEVVEIFQYGCGHCFRFETPLQQWLKNKPDNVDFVLMPAMFSPKLALYARAFYAAEALGVREKIHMPFFEAIHVQKRKIDTEDDIAELFAENGVDKEKFHKAFRSFHVESKVRRAAELGKRYGVEATPSMAVNGKYITNPGLTGGFKGMLNVVDNLIAQESK